MASRVRCEVCRHLVRFVTATSASEVQDNSEDKKIEMITAKKHKKERSNQRAARNRRLIVAVRWPLGSSTQGIIKRNRASCWLDIECH